MEIINASDIKPDDEWMQENEWDEIYKQESEVMRCNAQDVEEEQKS